MREVMTKSMARNIFYGGSLFFILIFVGLTAQSHLYITSTSTDKATLTDSVAAGKHLRVHEGDRVRAGDRLSEGPVNPHDILRIKGFVAVEGKPMRMLVQGVGKRFRRDFDRPWAPGEERLSRLVVIAQRGIDRDAVTAALTG